MHSAPWTNTSISAPQLWQTRAMSSRLSSRASTTRSMPRPSAHRAPPAVNRLIWVLAWMGRSGATAWASVSAPQSWISTASTPMSEALRSASAA